MEFTPLCLKLYGTEPKEFLQIFLNNGYEISPSKFLDVRSYTIDYIIKLVKNQMNLYITYSKIRDK